ncbi:helix-turn-helix domain-containing protein [Hydrogenophaga sp. RAC07]|uniref:helix-turn-helix domain-containing protein n=1 Tax=Hydrogenophaga sp. RAC07 TaxID=1842537 RepID=UPI0009F2A2FB
MGTGDIASQWGFSTQAHFARCFRAAYGQTPSDHRAASLPTAAAKKKKPRRLGRG